MTRVQKRVDCANSPKNEVLQELTIAMARGNEARVREFLTTSFEWLPVGRQPVAGVDAVCKALLHYGPASVLIIQHVISRGRSGAVDGVIEFGAKRRAFCNVFDFENSKGNRVRALTSYSVPL
jgi:hypothetical protein